MSKKENWRQKLKELEARIAAHEAAGEREEAAAGRAQKAMLHTMLLDFRAAAKEIARVGELAAEEGAMEELALAHLAQGKTLAQQGMGGAAEALDKAAALFHTLELPQRRAEAVTALANFHAGNGRYPAALQTIDQALESIDAETTPAPAVDLILLRAALHLQQNDLDAARTDLDKALAVAEASGDESLILAVRLQRDPLSDEATAESLADLLQQARRHGDSLQLNDVQLQQAALALQEERSQAAVEHATAARVAARDQAMPDSPLRYLLASLILADAHEQMDDRVRVLAALLTCKVYLEHTLGPVVGKQINQLLDALALRWGREGLETAVQAYQKHVAEHGPFPT
jgi:hypothetical protein